MNSKDSGGKPVETGWGLKEKASFNLAEWLNEKTSFNLAEWLNEKASFNLAEWRKACHSAWRLGMGVERKGVVQLGRMVK